MSGLFDVLVCTNLVNHTVALHGVRPGRSRPALLIHEPWRFEVQAQPRVWAVPLGIWSLRLLQTLVALRLVHTLYLPHDRFNRRVAWARRHVRRLAYLDDGLDTHRRVPRNFDLPLARRVEGPAPYLTFNDFPALPEWLNAFEVRRCCRLTDLAMRSGEPLLPLSGIDHVLVESPGLRPAQVISGLGLAVDRVLVIRHPVPAKRGDIPPQCRAIEGGGHNLEASLLEAKGKLFYFGETLALVFAAHCGTARHNRVLAQLTPEQRSNLPGLRWLPDADQRLAAVPGLLALAA